MQSTQRVEGQNAIIKSSVNGGTSLINLVKHIDEQINRASTLIQYKNWIHFITGSTLTNGSLEFSPDIDQWITNYLTPAALSMQRQEIAQAMWYTSRSVNNFDDLGLNSDSTIQINSNEQFDLTNLTEPEITEVFDIFVEDTVDAPAILVRELIPSADITSQIEPELQIRQCPFIIGLGGNIETTISAHIEQPFPDLSFCLPNISYKDVQNKINYRKAYVMVNGLSKKAIQTGLDAGCSTIQELEDFMNKFITKYTPKKKEKLNIRQLEEEEEVMTDDSSADEGFIEIENLIVHSRKGAPKKKRLKGSHESENRNASSSKQYSESQKARKPTQCQQCQNTGHNRASCEAWHNRQGISYSYN
ncbi:44533_t:CDS:2 [Gigaspora margarita]|uniref:44533_t:CDS:1 n=1 Tax=Gigaspora margarita TaxID=4874 RepID=A0ABN7VEG2_GIGMA|nr:44533_t:CDS:2 [Gigaspora margarita]